MTNALQKRTQPGYGLEHVVDNIFNHTLRRFLDGNFWDAGNAQTTGSVPVNVREKENQYELDVVAPGCRKEDFKIEVKASELLISFSQKEENKEQNEQQGWVRNEFMMRSFSRSFTLDETVNTEQISASYTDGILRLVLPKNEKAKPRLLSIDVK